MTKLRKAKKYINRYKKIGKRYTKDANSDKLLDCVKKCFLPIECVHVEYLTTQRKRVYKLFNRLIGHRNWSRENINYIINKRKEERRNKRIYSYGNKSLPKSK